MPSVLSWPKWARALLQSALVACYLLLAFFAIYRFHSKLAIASLAGSAFVAFGFPTAHSARPRVLLGGYACGIVCGVASCMVLNRLFTAWAGQLPVVIVFCVAAVFLTSFSMIMLSCQHPPATALAVSMVMEQEPLVMGLTMMGCVAFLCLFQGLFLRLMKRSYPGVPADEPPPAPPEDKG